MDVSIPFSGIIKVIHQFLTENNLNMAARSLEVETGVVTETLNEDLAFVRNLIMDGRWTELEEFCSPLVAANIFNIDAVLFAIRSQRFLELFTYKDSQDFGLDDTLRQSNLDETQITSPIVRVLVESLKTVEQVATDRNAFNSLAYLLTLESISDHPLYKHWTPFSGRMSTWENVRSEFSKIFPLDVPRKGVAGVSDVPAPQQLIRLLLQAATAQTVQRMVNDPRFLASDMPSELIFDPTKVSGVKLPIPGSALPEEPRSKGLNARVSTAGTSSVVGELIKRVTSSNVSIEGLGYNIPLLPPAPVIPSHLLSAVRGDFTATRTYRQPDSSVIVPDMTQMSVSFRDTYKLNTSSTTNTLGTRKGESMSHPQVFSPPRTASPRSVLPRAGMDTTSSPSNANFDEFTNRTIVPTEQSTHPVAAQNVVTVRRGSEVPLKEPSHSHIQKSPTPVRNTASSSSALEPLRSRDASQVPLTWDISRNLQEGPSSVVTTDKHYNTLVQAQSFRAAVKQEEATNPHPTSLPLQSSTVSEPRRHPTEDSFKAAENTLFYTRRGAEVVSSEEGEYIVRENQLGDGSGNSPPRRNGPSTRGRSFIGSFNDTERNTNEVNAHRVSTIPTYNESANTSFDTNITRETIEEPHRSFHLPAGKSIAPTLISQALEPIITPTPTLSASKTVTGGVGIDNTSVPLPGLASNGHIIQPPPTKTISTVPTISVQGAGVTERISKMDIPLRRGDRPGAVAPEKVVNPPPAVQEPPTVAAPSNVTRLGAIAPPALPLGQTTSTAPLLSANTLNASKKSVEKSNTIGVSLDAPSSAPLLAFANAKPAPSISGPGAQHSPLKPRSKVISHSTSPVRNVASTVSPSRAGVAIPAASSRILRRNSLPPQSSLSPTLSSSSVSILNHIESLKNTFHSTSTSFHSTNTSFSSTSGGLLPQRTLPGIESAKRAAERAQEAAGFKTSTTSEKPSQPVTKAHLIQPRSSTSLLSKSISHLAHPSNLPSSLPLEQAVEFAQSFAAFRGPGTSTEELLAVSASNAVSAAATVSSNTAAKVGALEAAEKARAGTLEGRTGVFSSYKGLTSPPHKNAVFHSIMAKSRSETTASPRSAGGPLSVDFSKVSVVSKSHSFADVQAHPMNNDRREGNVSLDNSTVQNLSFSSVSLPLPKTAEKDANRAKPKSLGSRSDAIVGVQQPILHDAISASLNSTITESPSQLVVDPIVVEEKEFQFPVVEEVQSKVFNYIIESSSNSNTTTTSTSNNNKNNNNNNLDNSNNNQSRHFPNLPAALQDSLIARSVSSTGSRISDVEMYALNRGMTPQSLSSIVGGHHLNFKRLGTFEDAHPIRALSFHPLATDLRSSLCIGTNGEALKFLSMKSENEGLQMSVKKEFKKYHLGSIYCISYGIRDDKYVYIASGSNDTILNVSRLPIAYLDSSTPSESADSSKILSVAIKANLGTIRDVAFIHDAAGNARYLAVAGSGKFSIKVYSVEEISRAMFVDGTESAEFENEIEGSLKNSISVVTVPPEVTLSGHSAAVHALFACPVPLVSSSMDSENESNGLKPLEILSVSDDGTMRLWHLGQPVPLVTTMALSPEGSQRPFSDGAPVAVAASTKGGLGLRTLRALGSLAVVGAADGSLLLVNFRSARMITSVPVHAGEVRSVDIRGPYILSCGFDGAIVLSTVGVRDLEDFSDARITVRHKVGHQTGEKALCVRFHPSKNVFASSSTEKSVVLWELVI